MASDEEFNNSNDSSSSSKVLTPRQLRLQAETENLENSLSTSDFSTLRTGVAFILNTYPASRNSDVTLQLKYWEHFEPEVLEDFNPNTLYQGTRLTSIARSRAKIQNEYGLFRADEVIRRGRRAQEDWTKEAMLQDQPGIPSISVYADESGKTDRCKIIAGVWSGDGHELFKFQGASTQWLESHRGPHEFHFVDVSPSSIDSYMAYWDWVMDNFVSLGFKAVIIDSQKLNRKIQETFHELYTLYIVHGLRHEWSTGRAPTTYTNINVLVDEEDSLKDAILRDKIHNAITDDIRRQGLQDVARIERISHFNSRELKGLQLADLFSGTVNRYTNTLGNGSHVKDRLANHIRDSLDIRWDGTKLQPQGDRVWIEYL